MGLSVHMRKVLILLLLTCCAINSRAQNCNPVFAAVAINGTQFNVATTLGFSPPVLTGNFTLHVQFRLANETVFNPVGNISLMYTIDNVSVGPVLNLTDNTNFGWTANSANILDGTHTISVLYVNESLQNPCITFLGRQYTFVVENQKIISGQQIVPVGATPRWYGSTLSPMADFVAYPGYQPHSTGHPYPAQVIPPAGGMTPTDLWAEPLVQTISGPGESIPFFAQLSNGSRVAEMKFPDLIGCDDRRMPKYGFDLLGPLWEQRKGQFDGLQDDASLSNYITFMPNLDGPGFYGVSMDGRLLLVGTNGSVQTIAGWTTNRTATPYDYLDGSIPMSKIETQQTLIGNFDSTFYFPSDLAIDPNNHSHIYVADMNNHRIALVDLSQQPPKITTVAGVIGQPGYLDGPGSSALFNQPSSLVVAADGSLYVADALNSVIRKIDTHYNVTTVVGVGPTNEPPTVVVAKNPFSYAPNGTVPFSKAYVNYPNVLRFDSKGNLVVGETVSLAIRYVDLSTETVTTIARLQNSGDGFGEQLWLDVDRNGNIGEKDDVIVSFVKAQQKGLFRVPITGTTLVPPPTITTLGTNPVYPGHTANSNQPFTASPWSVSIDDTEGRLFLSGVHGFGVVSLRLIQSSDPGFQINPPDYVGGRNVWITGTVPNFPFGSRPSFAAVHGMEGHSGLGNVQGFDDMISLTDTQLATYLQSGADGSTPRPELTGNDLRNVIYYIRRTATGGNNAIPGPDSTDKVAPLITGIGSSQKDSTDAVVAWSTSKPTLGIVQWGTNSGTYFGWSQIESNYNTNHSVTISNLPSQQTIYYVVQSKDLAGNQAISPEQNIMLH